MPIEANTLNAHESANSVRLSGVRVRFDQQQHRRGSRNRQSVGIELGFSISASQGPEEAAFDEAGASIA
jgi:hypothetical protein